MARKIVCEPCNDACTKAVEGYGEVWETIKGSARRDMVCDDCAVTISEGQICYAGVLVDKKTNSIYRDQHPRKWASHYIEEIKA